MGAFLKSFSNRLHKSVRLVHLLDYLLFAVFSMLYFAGLQADLLQLTLQRTVPSILRFPPFTIALILTLFLLAVKLLLNKALRLKGPWHSLSFLPSFLLLVWFTRFNSLCLLLFLASIVLLAFFSRSRRAKSGIIHTSFSVQLQANLLIMVFCFFIVVLLGNANDLLHYELKMERQLAHGRYQSALRVAADEQATSRRLVALRAFALSRSHQMGENLFEYPMPRGNQDLFLHPSDSAEMLLPMDSLRSLYGTVPTEKNYFKYLSAQVQDTAWHRHPALADYYLCSLLLKKKVRLFAETLPRFYNVEGDLTRLPKHYKEALVILKRYTMNPAVLINDVPTETNYSDFLEELKKYPNPHIRSNYARRLYGNTYFWYYYFG